MVILALIDHDIACDDATEVYPVRTVGDAR